MTVKTAPKKGWKAIQDKSKTKKKIKLAVIVAGNLIKLTQAFFVPWKISDSQSKKYLWNGKFNINLAVKKNADISIISYKDRKSTRLNSSHSSISYAVFCLKK